MTFHVFLPRVPPLLKVWANCALLVCTWSQLSLLLWIFYVDLLWKLTEMAYWESFFPLLRCLRIFVTLLEHLFVIALSWLYNMSRDRTTSLRSFSSLQCLLYINIHQITPGFFSPIPCLLISVFYSLNKKHMLKDIIQGSFIETLSFSQSEFTPWKMLFDHFFSSWVT